MSFLDDIIKKMTEDNMVLNTTKDIMKGTENLMKQKDKLTEATSNILIKEMPNIEREIGRNTLAQAVQAPNMMAQGRAMPSSILDQQILNNSQGQFLNQPSIMPQVDLGKVDVRKNLSDTVASQKKDNFLSRLPAEAGKFMQSVGYGLLDKPLNREGGASTWDYLGKTIGQIARLNEGSGLGMGQQIYEQPQAKLQQAVQLAQVKGENRLPTYAQSQEQLATVAALRSGKYALKGDFTGELARQDIKTFDDALTYVTYKGINPNDPTILEALKKYPVTKNGKVVGKFAGFDTDGEILVE